LDPYYLNYNSGEKNFMVIDSRWWVRLVVCLHEVVLSGDGGFLVSQKMNEWASESVSDNHKTY
jgi:hypothetical protein